MNVYIGMCTAFALQNCMWGWTQQVSYFINVAESSSLAVSLSLEAVDMIPGFTFLMLQAVYWLGPKLPFFFSISASSSASSWSTFAPLLGSLPWAFA